MKIAIKYQAHRSTYVRSIVGETGAMHDFIYVHVAVGCEEKKLFANWLVNVQLNK